MTNHYPTYYQYFKKQNPELLHFAAHSHHPWPDVSLEGQQQYWYDSNTLTDKKWNTIFGEVIPDFQQKVAKILGVEALQSNRDCAQYRRVCGSTFQLFFAD
jgi:hypothetical protein